MIDKLEALERYFEDLERQLRNEKFKVTTLETENERLRKLLATALATIDDLREGVHHG